MKAYFPRRINIPKQVRSHVFVLALSRHNIKLRKIILEGSKNKTDQAYETSIATKGDIRRGSASSREMSYSMAVGAESNSIISSSRNTPLDTAAVRSVWR